MTKLSKASYNYALKHLLLEGDTDLFPPAFELKALKFNWEIVIDQLNKLDLANYKWNSGRRFVVPTQQLAFRTATQLEPLDSLILTAIIKTFGSKIEAARIPVKEKRVFSYRFDPQPDGRLFGQGSKWHEFWQTSLERVIDKGYKWIAIADISDYYNQIYHHVLGNQLIAAKLPKLIAAIIEKNFLGAVTHGVSRGIPVGPHSVHLLAECALIPIDRSLLSGGHDFCRYVDDFHFFCRSEEDAKITLFNFADILDKQQRLILQKQKTRILHAEEFVELAKSMLVDQPLSEDEQEVIEVIKKYSDGPYENVSLSDISEEDLEAVESEKIVPLFEIYLSEDNVNYTRIGWLLRRLAQVGAPGAVDFILENLTEFTPVLGDTARYIMRASPNYEGNLEDTGELILEALDNPLISNNEYIQMILLNLFAEVKELNHINHLTKTYQRLQSSARREVIMAAGSAGYGHWIKERKDDFAMSDQWIRRAIIRSLPSFPGDEGEHWLKKIKPQLTGIEKLVARWTFKDKNLKVGSIEIN